MTTASSDFPAVGESVGAARRYAVRALDDLGLHELGDDVRTVVSELATNAVLHARTPFTVVLSRQEEHLRVRLVDRSPGRPRPTRLRDAGATTGRGLHIVAGLSAAWGVEATDEGKAVWCDLPVQPRARSTQDDLLAELDLDALLAGEPDAAGRGATGPVAQAGHEASAHVRSAA